MLTLIRAALWPRFLRRLMSDSRPKDAVAASSVNATFQENLCEARFFGVLTAF
jgi:hypothetical protein